MALVQTNTGAPEWGAGVITGLATATAAILFPPQGAITDPRNANNPLQQSTYPISTSLVNRDRASMSLIMNVSATQTFNLDYEFSPDGGTTWYVGDQVASVTVTVDGGAAGYTQAAQINVQVGYQYRYQMYNTSGSTLNAAYEWRLYSDVG